MAASPHKKPNGKGYHRGLRAEQLSTETRILVVADIFDALSAKRPYRDALPLDTVFNIMRKDVPHALNAACLEALAESGFACDQSFVDLHTLKQALAQTEVAALTPAAQ